MQNMSPMDLYPASFSQNSRQQYTMYLENQLQRFSSFILHQTKQNLKHHQLIQVIEDQNEKIKLLNDKVLLVELYQNQNLKNQQKLFNSVQKAISLQKRVNKLQLFGFQDKSYTKKFQNQMNSGRQLIIEIERKIHKMHLQIHEQLSHMQTSLIERLKSSSENTQASKKTQGIKQKIQRIQSKDSMSPLQTNYSENDRSRLNQIHQNLPLTQKYVKPQQRKITNFVQQKLYKLEPQMTDRNIQKNHSIHSSMKENQMFQQQQRSPISTYLKKENQYKSHAQNSALKNQVAISKPFYSAGNPKQTKTLKHNQIKSKSKSKSKSRTNRSVSKSNKSKSKHKCDNHISDFKLKQNSDKNIKPRKNKENKTEKIKKTHTSLYQKINLNLNLNQSNKFKDKNLPFCNNKSNKNQRISQLQLSQVTNRSQSRSKSNQKAIQNQKQYLMYCNKYH